MIHVTTVRGNACHHTKTNVTICTLVAAFGHLSCYENMFYTEENVCLHTHIKEMGKQPKASIISLSISHCSLYENFSVL